MIYIFIYALEIFSTEVIIKKAVNFMKNDAQDIKEVIKPSEMTHTFYYKTWHIYISQANTFQISILLHV